MLMSNLGILHDLDYEYRIRLRICELSGYYERCSPFRLNVEKELCITNIL